MHNEVIKTMSATYWREDGKLHRDGDLPAVVWNNGDKEWYQKGERCRADGKPVVERGDGGVEYAS